MYYTDLETFVISCIFIVIIAISLICAYGWLVEHTKRKEIEKRNKEIFEAEMALLKSGDIKDKNYKQYAKEVEKSIAKERGRNKDVLL